MENAPCAYTTTPQNLMILAYRDGFKTMSSYGNNSCSAWYPELHLEPGEQKLRAYLEIQGKRADLGIARRQIEFTWEQRGTYRY